MLVHKCNYPLKKLISVFEILLVRLVISSEKLSKFIKFSSFHYNVKFRNCCPIFYCDKFLVSAIISNIKTNFFRSYQLLYLYMLFFFFFLLLIMVIRNYPHKK